MNTLNAPEQTLTFLLVGGVTYIPTEHVSEGERLVLQGIHPLTDPQSVVLRAEVCVGRLSEYSSDMRVARLVKVLPLPERET